jgi:hypothetical protein
VLLIDAAVLRKYQIGVKANPAPKMGTINGLSKRIAKSAPKINKRRQIRFTAENLVALPVATRSCSTSKTSRLKNPLAGFPRRMSMSSLRVLFLLGENTLRKSEKRTLNRENRELSSNKKIIIWVQYTLLSSFFAWGIR